MTNITKSVQYVLLYAEHRSAQAFLNTADVDGIMLRRLSRIGTLRTQESHFDDILNDCAPHHAALMPLHNVQ